MASKINYNNKAPFQTLEEIPDENKVNANDMNEIKTVVNNNADELNTAKEDIEGLQNGQGTASTDITSLKNRTTALETDNTTNKQNIQNLQTDNETNKTNITNLQNSKVDKVEGKNLSTNDFTNEYKQKLDNLSNYDDTEVKADIAELEEKVSTLEEDNTTNKTNIEALQEDNTQNKSDISDLQESQEEQDAEIGILMNALPSETQEGENINIKGTIPVKFKEFVVGGNSKQETRSGKNRLPYPYSSIANTIIQDLGDGRLTLNGTIVENVSKNIKTFDLKAGNYKFLFNNENLPNNSYFYIRNQDTSATLKTNIKTNTTFTLEEDVQIRIYLLLVAGTYSNYEMDLMILEATEEDETWEPYGASPSPEYPSKIQNVEGNANVAVCSKNIAKIDTINKTATRNGVTITIDDDGIITLNGTATANMYVNVLNITDISGANMENYNLPKRNYKAYFELIAKNNSQISSEGNGDLQFYFRNRAVSTEEIKSFSYAQFIRIIQGNTGVTVKDMQITENTIVSYAYIPVGVVLDNLKFRFAIFNENETDTTYVKHEEENYILPVQEELLEGDYFVKEADGWKEVHTWNKKILNGIENWALNSVYPSVFYLDNLDNIDTDRNDYELKCDTYKYVDPISTSANAQNNTIFGFLQNSTTLFSRITIKDERFTTVRDFKNNLESKNVIAYYKNAIPTKLPCTEEQIAVLEQLNNAKSYEDSTNVYSTNEVSPIFKVTAIKDINSVITQLNQLILENGGN